ncbi:MAG: Ldh family oxidoreductase [Candidatus Dojkabacteria bacterium]|nr:Ldh family oxidoreductase [Candidatus Dojkabacteria bacterium]
MHRSIKITDAERLLEKAASKFVTSSEARYFSQFTISNHLKKYPRINPFNEAVSDIESWQLNENSKEKIVVEKKASVLIDFDELAPSLRLKWIHDELLKRSRESGISMVGIYNSGGIHSLNYWTEGLAQRNLIGISFYQGGYGGVVPYGGTKGIFGTAPISYAIPTDSRPILADMATSNIAYFDLLKAKKQKTKLPRNSAVDKNGVPTVDPNRALFPNLDSNLLPIGGGYKGFSLLLLVEILSGALVRGCLSHEFTLEADDPTEQGFVIIAIDVSTFTVLSRFKKSISSLCDQLRNQKPGKGFKKILIPGDAGYNRMEKLKQSGSIPVDKNILDKLALMS